MKQLAVINSEYVTDEEMKEYSIREASRAVVTDQENNVALLHVVHEGYYKLPGGGIEDQEDKITALKRECREEIGCDVEVMSEIGVIIEYRKKLHLKQTSYCYYAKLKGEKGVSDFTKEELDRGFEQIWLPYDKAMELMEKNRSPHFEGSSYIVPRDTVFLKAAKEYLV